MGALRKELNLAQKFAATGRTWVELDDDGNVVAREAASDDGVVTGKVVAKTGKAAARGAASKPVKGTGRAAGVRSAR